MAGQEKFMVQLSRPNSSVSWGFRLQGGADFSTPLSIQLVSIVQIVVNLSYEYWLAVTATVLAVCMSVYCNHDQLVCI